VLFDFGFGQAAGQLVLSLGGSVIDSIDAVARTPQVFRTRLLHVSDPALQGQSGLPLRFGWSGGGSDVAWIDNVRLYPVPEPSRTSGLVTALAVLAALRRRRAER